MAIADVVLFNSHFHLGVWSRDIGALLNRFPDYKHTDLLPTVASKYEVLPVGVDLRRLDGVAAAVTRAPLILWNQRWDFDKGPDEFAAAMIELAATHDFEVALAGEQIMELEPFTRLQVELGQRIVHVGHAGDEDYVRLLASAAVVVSTATQEFFGIAVTEAVYAGAFPVLPNSLVYPERLPEHLHTLCLYEPGDLVDRLRWSLDHPSERAEATAAMKEVMAAFDWSVIAPRYDARFDDLVAATPT
jgi:glycosyltransferase involved in cell wall biosynthesis